MILIEGIFYIFCLIYLSMLGKKREGKIKKGDVETSPVIKQFMRRKFLL